MITIQLPNGQEVDIDGTNDPQVAARAAQTYWHNQDRPAFEAWRRALPLSGPLRAAADAAMGTAGGALQGAGAVGEQLGLGGQTLRNAGAAISPDEPLDTRNLESFSDAGRQLLSQPFSTLGNIVGMAAGSIAAVAPAVVAGIAAAPAVGLGAVAGGTIGAAAMGALGSVGETEQLLRAEGVDPDRARLLATTLGTAVGMIEAAPIGALLTRALGREVRQETVQRLAEIAARRAGPAAARGAAVGSLLAAGGELAGELGREGIAAAETGNLNLAERLDRAALEGLAGGAAGAGLGGYAGYRDPARAQAAINQRPQFGPTERPADPAGPEPEPPLPPQPEAFSDPAAAEDFIRNVPEARPPANVTDPAERMAWASAVQQQTWEQEVEILRSQELSNFLGVPAIRDIEGLNVNRQGQAEVLLPNLAKAAGQGTLDLNGFTVQEVATLGLTPLQVDGPSGTEMGRTRKELNALVQDGFLQRVGKGTFSIAPRYLSKKTAERLTRRENIASIKAGDPTVVEEAPKTEQQRAVESVLGVLDSGVLQMAQPAEQQAFLAGIARKDAATAKTASRLIQLQAEATELQRATVNQETDIVARDAKLSELANERASLTDVLRGQMNLAAVGDQLVDAPVVREKVVPNANSLGDLNTNNMDAASVLTIMNNALNKHKEAVADKTASAQQAQDAELRAAFETEPVVELMRGLAAPRGQAQFSPKMWQDAFDKDAGIKLTPEQAAVVHDIAKKRGVLDGMNRYAAPKPPTNPPTSPPTDQSRAFTTDKGSQYVLHSDGTTTRNKAARAEHPGDSGLKQRSAKTWFLTREDMNRLAVPQGDWRLIDHGDGTLSVATRNKSGKWGIAPSARNVPAQSEPAVGLHPVEVWGGETIQSRQAYNNIHYGNAINSLDATANQPKKPRGRRPIANLAEGQAPPQAMEREAVVDAVADSISGWKNAPTILVVDSEAEIPNLPPDHPPIKGVYDAVTGIVYVNVGRMADADDVRATVFHESLAHWGLRQEFQTGLAQLLRDIYASNADLRAQADAYQAAYMQDFQHPEDYMLALEEVLARKLEGGEALPIGVLDKIVNFLRALAKKMGFLKGQYTEAEVASILNAARDKVMDGSYSPIPNTPYGTNLFSAVLPANAAKGRAVVQAATRDYIVGPLKWFASPIMTIAKSFPQFLWPGQLQQASLLRKQQFSSDVLDSLAPLAKLPPAESAELARILMAGSEARKVPDLSKLNAAQQEAGKGVLAAGQRAFDYLIEAYAYESFNPEAAKTPAERAKLEKFWAKNLNKHLWEIPAAEVRAASAEGAAMMDRLNKLRNPAYVPALAQGSHFVGVYQKNSKGERTGPPLKMVAYTPLNMAQKLRRFDDPEVAAHQELERLYPDTKRYSIMQQGVQFTRDAEAAKIRNQGDVIADYLQKLRDMPEVSNSNAAQRELSKLLDGLDKAQMDRVFRPNQGVLMSVTSANAESYLMDVLPSYFMGVANVQARRFTQGDWSRAMAPLSPNDKAYMNDLRDYSTASNEAFSSLRTITFFSLLGGALDSAMLNGLQIFQTTAPMLIRDGGVKSMQHFGSAFKDVSTRLGDAFKESGDFGKAIAKVAKSPTEASVLERAAKLDVFMPLYTTESRGQVTADTMRRAGSKNPTKSAHAVNTVAKLLGKFQQTAEQVNRAVTFLAAYRLAVADPNVIANTNKYDNTNFNGPDAAFQYALGKVGDTQYTTTKEDRALIQRFTPAAEIATQFMSYPLKTAENYVRHASMVLRGFKDSDPDIVRAGIIGVLGQAAPLVALAGIWALPGADFLREALEALVKLGWGGAQNFDADMRRMLGGGFTAEAIVRGLPQAYGVAAISDRLKVDPVSFQDVTGMQMTSLMGPAGNLIEGPIRSYQFAQQGDYVNALAAFPLIPRAVGNIIRGADQAATGEIRTPRGTTLLAPDQMDEINSRSNLPVWARTALGFQSPEVVGRREGLVRQREMIQAASEATSKFNKRAADHIVDMYRARQTGDGEAVARSMRQFNELIHEQVRKNATAVERGQLERVININASTIQRRALADFQGRSADEVMGRTGPRQARGRIADEVGLYNWRSGN